MAPPVYQYDHGYERAIGTLIHDGIRAALAPITKTPAKDRTGPVVETGFGPILEQVQPTLVALEQLQLMQFSDPKGAAAVITEFVPKNAPAALTHIKSMSIEPSNNQGPWVRLQYEVSIYFATASRTRGVQGMLSQAVHQPDRRDDPGIDTVEDLMMMFLNGAGLSFSPTVSHQLRVQGTETVGLLAEQLWRVMAGTVEVQHERCFARDASTIDATRTKHLSPPNANGPVAVQGKDLP